MDYRDGLMIAFLALCPIRVANLAAMTIGRHLTFAGGRPHIQFAAAEMPKVATEMALAVLAYNFTRVMYILGVKPMIAAMRA